MTNKRWGRVGDSPIIGAGTYAQNSTCGVSATGTGEYFIRLSVARDIAALMEYEGKSVSEAAEIVINKKLTALGGDGGVIAMDRKGNITMTFNTSGMYRGYVKPNGAIVTAIYQDEKTE
jgi:beta-aspartyl-peptidase (threonine type)